jgi:hypothetical protein
MRKGSAAEGPHAGIGAAVWVRGPAGWIVEEGKGLALWLQLKRGSCILGMVHWQANQGTYHDMHAISNACGPPYLLVAGRPSEVLGS